MVVVWPHCSKLGLACFSAVLLPLPEAYLLDLTFGEGKGGEGSTRPPGEFCYTLCMPDCFSFPRTSVSWSPLDARLDVVPCFEYAVEVVQNPDG